jgi:SNF2 family DNA or RNA helicase
VLDRSDLRRYQEHAVAFIKATPNCALWVDMGLGKTVSTLTAFAEMQDAVEVSKMLVIAPLRVARKVWKDEIAEWSHLTHLTISCVTGTEKECFAALTRPADIHTINRERLPWLEAQFFQNGKQIVEWPWDIVAVDESQSFKSQSSQRWKSASRLRKLFPRMVQLTGTPSPNGYMDLWSQFSLLDNGKRLGSAETDMRERWFTPPVGMFTKWSLMPRAEKSIQARVQDIVLSLKESDYLTLPPALNNFIRVQLSPAAMAKYKEMARKLTTEVRGTKLTAVNAGVLDGKLLQLANGACYHGDEGKWVTFHDAKIDALGEALEGLNGKKALIAYAYKHDLARIEKVLAAQDEPWAVLKSDESFERWARGEFTYGVLHPASAGHGLNDVYKSGAEDLIHFGMNANLELYQQVNARLTGGHRRQGRNVTVHHIVADGTRDDDYVALLKRKAFTQDDLTESLAVKIAA